MNISEQMISELGSNSGPLEYEVGMPIVQSVRGTGHVRNVHYFCCHYVPKRYFLATYIISRAFFNDFNYAFSLLVITPL